MSFVHRSRSAFRIVIRLQKLALIRSRTGSDEFASRPAYPPIGLRARPEAHPGVRLRAGLEQGLLLLGVVVTQHLQHKAVAPLALYCFKLSVFSPFCSLVLAVFGDRLLNQQKFFHELPRWNRKLLALW